MAILSYSFGSLNMVAKKEVLRSNPEKCGFSHRPSDRLSFVYIFLPFSSLIFRVDSKPDLNGGSGAAALQRFSV
jgi:hypothetical protein